MARMGIDLLGDHAAPGYDDPLGMLAACHRRIERQLATLGRLQRHLPEHGCDNDARGAARGILKYFDTAAIHHHADEEESIFPRLVALAPQVASALVADLAADHHRLASHWRHVRPLLAAIAAGARANLGPRQVMEIRRAYDLHIAREEAELIPLAGALLPPSALAEVSREMAARRGLGTAALPF
jgi:hemerythrin-like domain-containing protein